jgi:hypothetical protein
MPRLQSLTIAVALGGGLVTGLAGPGVAAPFTQSAAVEKLERKVQKEVEEATEILSDVQSGAMKFDKGMAKLKGFLKNAEKLQAMDANVGQQYVEELQATIVWTKKFAPIEIDWEKYKPPPDHPASKPLPDTPATKPRKQPAKAAPTVAKRKPKEAATAEITWDEIVVPQIPTGLDLPDLPDRVHPRAKILIPLLKDPNVGKRIWAGVVAPTCPTPALVQECFRVLRTGKDPREQMAAAFAISNSRHVEVFKGFDQAVEEWDEGEQIDRLMLVMSSLPEKRTVAAMFKLAMRFDRPTGGADSMDRQALRQYRDKARSNWRQGWRARVAAVWRTWPEPVVSAGLTEFFGRAKKRKDTRMMQETLLACGVIGDERGIRHAVPFLTQGREELSPLRAPAMAAVEMVGKPSVPWLIYGLKGKTKNWSVRALREISGTVMSSQPKLWWAWWADNR